MKDVSRDARLWRRVSAALMLAACGCNPAPRPTLGVTPPRLPQAQVSPPAARPTSGAVAPGPLAGADTAHEAHVKIDTHGADVDVRSILDFLGEQAGITFQYSPDINKKVRVRLLDLPVSEALQSVLSSAGLTLETTNSVSRVPGTPSIVFYQLPVNVDSLSVDAIIARFGVSRGIAELLVRSRAMP